MTKKIIFYPSNYRPHNAYDSLIENPPEGYEFIIPKEDIRSISLRKIREYKLARLIYKFFRYVFPKTNPLKLTFSDSNTHEADIVFSLGVPYNGNKDWILHILDIPYSLTGYDYKLFLREKNNLNNLLSKSNCKKIICANESSIKIMKKHFSREILKKTKLIRPGISIQNYKKDKHNGTNLLFMGSINNPKNFYMKGGLEAIYAFDKLSKEYKDVHLTIRSWIPKEVKRIIKDNKKIMLIEKEMGVDDLKLLYYQSDLFLLPGHVYVLMGFLEAMSYGLPIICLDTWGSRDYVKNNINGILVKPSEKLLGYKEEEYPTNVYKDKFIESLKSVDKEVINSIYLSLKKVIENNSLRNKMSKKSIKFVKRYFSISKQRKEFKKIFDKGLPINKLAYF